jgi:hypothetical protein
MYIESLLLCIMASWGCRIVVALSNLLIITTLYFIYIVFFCLADHKFVAIIFLFFHLRGAAGCCALGRAAHLPRRTTYHWLRGRMPPVALPGKEAGYLGQYRRSIMAPDEAAAAELMIVETFDTRLVGAAFPILTICFRCNARAPT